MTDLYIREMGTGTPLVCLHGGMGLDHTLFLPWFDAFAKTHRVVLFDFTGNGRSRPDAPDEAMSIAAWVEDVEKVRAGLGLERITILGHSFGGFIAQEYALRHPDRLEAMILANTAPVVDFGAEILANAKARGTPTQVEAVTRGLTTPTPSDPAMAETFAAILPLYFHRWDPEAGAALLEDIVYRHRAFNVGNTREMPGFDTRERLGGIRTQTLVLSGADDWIMPSEYGGRRLAEGIRGARHHVFQESGHFPYIEEPQAFVAEVTAFLAATGEQRP